jgi:hypothetical protein
MIQEQSDGACMQSHVQVGGRGKSDTQRGDRDVTTCKEYHQSAEVGGHQEWFPPRTLA